MKPFNLEEAKQGKPVCNRAGEDVRIVCFDRKSDLNYSIIALHTNDGAEDLFSHRINGKYKEDCLISKFDLFMKGGKREGWVNIYRYGDNNCTSNIIHKTFEAAYKNRNADGYITTTKIEWEE